MPRVGAASVGSFRLTSETISLAVRMLGWRLVLPLLKHLVPLPRLTRLLWSAPVSHQPCDTARALRIAAVAQRMSGISGRVPHANCLERSLLAYRFLSKAGAGPVLMVGFRRIEGNVLGHAWVAVGHSALGESGPVVQDYVPAVCFGERGQMVPLGEAAAEDPS